MNASPIPAGIQSCDEYTAELPAEPFAVVAALVAALVVGALVVAALVVAALVVGVLVVGVLVVGVLVVVASAVVAVAVVGTGAMPFMTVTVALAAADVPALL